MADSSPSLRQSFAEYGRGVAGGLLFSLPLLYTEEVWERAALVRPLPLLLALLFTFLLLLGYNRYAGLHEDTTWMEIVIDSVEELGLGILVAGGLLWLLDRVNLGMSFEEAFNRVILEALVVAVGVSVGTAQLGTGNTAGQDQAGQGMTGDDLNKKTVGSRLGSQVVLGACGAFLVTSNISPTVEIVQIGSETAPWKLLLLALASLALGALILFFSNFVGTRRSGEDKLTRLEVVQGAVVTYAVALVISALVLWFFDRFQDTGPAVSIAYLITAGLPAVLGASAGRLLLQT